MILSNELRTAMLDAYDRRLRGYPRRDTLLAEAIELLQYGDIGGWVKRPTWKHDKGTR